MKFTKDDKELRELAKDVISEFENVRHLANYKDQVRIGYQWSDRDKVKNGCVVYGDCEKVKPKLKQFIDYDFIITFYASAKEISDRARKILMYHELRHIGIDKDDMGELTFYIVPHDIEDFSDIINTYGEHWQTSIV